MQDLNALLHTAMVQTDWIALILIALGPSLNNSQLSDNISKLAQAGIFGLHTTVNTTNNNRFSIQKSLSEPDFRTSQSLFELRPFSDATSLQELVALNFKPRWKNNKTLEHVALLNMPSRFAICLDEHDTCSLPEPERKEGSKHYDQRVIVLGPNISGISRKYKIVAGVVKSITQTKYSLVHANLKSSNQYHIAFLSLQQI